ncbi:hypothetical protein DL770_005097 [Monosporascus sp. CRB-9-2]|nr:hypothetical protein DL770_005097 [Monosporascus sp. CRB-9-2]
MRMSSKLEKDVAWEGSIRGDNAAKKLAEEYPEAEIRVWIVDLADYDSVINFANRCKDLDRLDFAILNAAVQLTSLSAERNIREAGKPPVITVVGSDTMYLSKFEAPGPILPMLDDETRYTRFDQYRDSKLLLMMYARLMYTQEGHDISKRLWQETMKELRFASDSGFAELFTAGDHGSMDSRE